MAQAADITVLQEHLGGVLLLATRRYEDPRGFLCESFSRRRLAQVTGSDCEFVQENVSVSQAAGTLRGLHFQVGSAAQAKLVRVVRGAMLDVVVDLRRSAASYGKHAVIELDADPSVQLFIPPGFAHGFLTRVPETEVSYRLSAYYDAKAERGIRWDDPDLAIDWRLEGRPPVLSDRDRTLPRLRELGPQFA